MLNPNTLAARIISDPAASYWLKDAVRALLSRDVVDAMTDAETLSTCVREHYQLATGRVWGKP